jgi:hypothetical protein
VNQTAEKVKLRSMGINASKLLGAARLPLNEIAFTARLAPGEQVNVQSTIGIDPQTPPGVYPMQLMIGGNSVEAVAHVTEVVDLRIQPDEITLLAGKDLVYEREFVIENAGNVPLPSGERCEAPLLDSMDLITSMLVGLSHARGEENKKQVQSWLSEWGQLAVGTLTVVREPMILAPGQKIAITARFELPPNLAPLRHYRASLQIYNATVAIDIYTTAKGGTKPPPNDPDVPRSPRAR